MCGEAPAAGATGTARDCCWGRRAPVFDRVLALGLNTYRLYIACWIAASGGSQGGREPKPGSSMRSWHRPPRGAGGSSDHQPSAYTRETGRLRAGPHPPLGGPPGKKPGIGPCTQAHCCPRCWADAGWARRLEDFSAATGHGGQAPRLDVEDKRRNWVSSEHFGTWLRSRHGSLLGFHGWVARRVVG